MATNAPGDRISMICPNLGCGKAISAPASARGKIVRCPYCNAPFRVPETRRDQEPNRS